MPSSFIAVPPGALSPKRSMPTTAPSRPTYWRQSGVTPAVEASVPNVTVAEPFGCAAAPVGNTWHCRYGCEAGFWFIRAYAADGTLRWTHGVRGFRDPRQWRATGIDPILASVLQRRVHAITQEMASAKTGRLAALTVEGEPGIGKTRLLVAAVECAAAEGFTSIAVTADEELRGPFLVARSILGSPEAYTAAVGSAAAEALERCLDSMSGQDDPGLATLTPDRRLLRTFDLGAVAFRALAAERPVAVLIDDLQWADELSLEVIGELALLLVEIMRASPAQHGISTLLLTPDKRNT